MNSAPKRRRRRTRAATPATSVTVCYDGTCELCAESVARVRSVYHGRRIRWVPYQDLAAELPEAAGQLDGRDLASAIHVIDADGTVHAGAAGILRIAEIVPRLQLFARLGRLPVINLLVEPMYWFIARHRHRLSRLLRLEGSRAG
jgi:predicted DCC family thiol-disulfide oxidoreductase YuxK